MGISQGRRILIVDDEPDLRDIMQLALQAEGFDASVAENGRVAWEIIQSGETDLVISDVRMPGMDGIDLLEKMRAANSTVPVILMTGFADMDETSVIALGAYELLSKPFEVDSLYRAVVRALAS